MSIKEATIAITVPPLLQKFVSQVQKSSESDAAGQWVSEADAAGQRVS